MIDEVVETAKQTVLRRVVVLGASGATGRELVRVLAEREFEVTAFARTTAQSQWGVRSITGSVLVPDDVVRAVDGQDAVIWAVGGHDAIRTLLSGNPRQKALCERGTENVITAMRARHVRRLVVISSWGVGDGRKRLPLPFRFLLPMMMGAELRDKDAQERLVVGSELAWTIVRPAILKAGRTGVPLSVAERQSFVARSHVARGDLAGLLTDLIRNDEVAGKTLEIQAAA
jgi:nucleoside-diphosphate-sugar epimerase